MQLAADQRRNRSELATRRDQANRALANLKIEKAKAESDKRVAEADLGRVRNLAKMIGAGDQDVLRWFILVVALLLDPAAVLLLLAATRR
jgi:phage antirepressor YoqD-like protein